MLQRPVQPPKAPRRSSSTLIWVILAGIVIVLIFLISNSCSGEYHCPYDWNNLTQENGRFAYHENGKIASRTGIDVSEHNGDIAWDKVAADDIEFAFVRIGVRGYTQGEISQDSCFETNISQAKQAGLDVGIYFFTQATSEEEAIEEAEFVLDTLNGRNLDLPVIFDKERVLDWNVRANGLDEETATACALAFCKRIEEGGYRAGIYGSTRDFEHLDVQKLSKYPLWIAAYDINYPETDYDFAIWQYANTGEVAGIQSSVDMNILFATAPVSMKR